MADARESALEDAALAVEAFAETKTPNFWTALREAARCVRALKAPPSNSETAEQKGNG